MIRYRFEGHNHLVHPEDGGRRLPVAASTRRSARLQAAKRGREERRPVLYWHPLGLARRSDWSARVKAVFPAPDRQFQTYDLRVLCLSFLCRMSRIIKMYNSTCPSFCISRR
jgi:hypothetical protein